MTPATDVYALGTVLYEMLSGRLPFPVDGGAMLVMHAHAYEDPTPLDHVAPEVPAALVDVTMRALSRDRTERYQSAEQFGADLAAAANQVWDTGWVGRHHLVVVPSGHIARNLSLPPKVRDPAADDPMPGPTTRPAEAAADGVVTGDHSSVTDQPTVPPPPAAAFASPAPAAGWQQASPAPAGWWLASDGRWYPPSASPFAGQAAWPAKSKRVAAALAFFLGAFGAHRFYLGYAGLGLTMLLLTVLSVFLLFPFILIWGWVDVLVILTGTCAPRTAGHSADGAAVGPLRRVRHQVHLGHIVTP